MVVKHLTHFACDRLFAPVDVSGVSALESNAVEFFVSDLSACRKAGIVDYHSLRLIFSDSRVNPVFLPVGIGFFPHAVKPDAADFAVRSTENFNALYEIIYILRKIAFIVGIVPVEQGMIEKRHNARFIALIDEFADQISAACGMRCVEIVKPFGVVQRKSVVMTKLSC